MAPPKRGSPLLDEGPNWEEVIEVKGKKSDLMYCDKCKQEVVITSEPGKTEEAGKGELQCCGVDMRKWGS